MFPHGSYEHFLESCHLRPPCFSISRATRVDSHRYSGYIFSSFTQLLFSFQSPGPPLSNQYVSTSIRPEYGICLHLDVARPSVWSRTVLVRVCRYLDCLSTVVQPPSRLSWAFTCSNIVLVRVLLQLDTTRDILPEGQRDA